MHYAGRNEGGRGLCRSKMIKKEKVEGIGSKNQTIVKLTILYTSRVLVVYF